MSKINFERMTLEQRTQFFDSLVDVVKRMVETFSNIRDYPPKPPA